MQDKNVINITFPSLLGKAMLSRDLMQKDLSQMTGITHSAISKYLSGQSLPRIPELIKLAKVLGVTTDYLLGLTSITPEPQKDALRIVALEAKLQMITSALQAVLDKAKE